MLGSGNEFQARSRKRGVKCLAPLYLVHYSIVQGKLPFGKGFYEDCFCPAPELLDIDVSSYPAALVSTGEFIPWEATYATST